MPRTRRKAVSPVLATVIMIAITIVGGVAVAGFAFGLFGTVSASANIKVTTVACTHGTAAASKCVVKLVNSGNGVASAVDCSLSGADSTLVGSPKEIDPGETTQATCKVTPASTVPGEPVEGTFTLDNGISVSFAGLYK